MKILLINDNHSTRGGAENYFFDLKNKLVAHKGLQICSLGFGNKEELGQDYFILKQTNSKLFKLLWRMVINPRMYFKIRRLIKKINPDVIHLHNIKQFPLSLLRALDGFKVVQTMHDYSGLCPTAQNIHKDKQPCPTGIRLACFWQHQVKHSKLMFAIMALSFYKIRKQLRKRVNYFIAPSPQLATYLQQNHFVPAIYIAPFVNRTAAPPVVLPQRHYFLFAGNLGEHKGGRLLLEEFALALKVNRELQLSIAGSGPAERQWRRLANELKIDANVKFLGWQTALSKHYIRHQALIFPSIGLESFGLVMTEAMNHARPVIAVNRGSAAWLVQDNETGFLFDPTKKGDLAEQILKIASDYELSLRLGLAGYERLARFDDELSVAKILEVFSSLQTSEALKHSLS